MPILPSGQKGGLLRCTVVAVVPDTAKFLADKQILITVSVNIYEFR